MAADPVNQEGQTVEAEPAAADSPTKALVPPFTRCPCTVPALLPSCSSRLEQSLHDSAVLFNGMHADTSLSAAGLC